MKIYKEDGVDIMTGSQAAARKCDSVSMFEHVSANYNLKFFTSA